MNFIMTTKPQKSGFTLIELLIVVAIIAILAAIAVPNFLEAQTRSKVSRAKADLRSMTVALESYRIDGNAYPSMFPVAPDGPFTGGVAPLAGSNLKWWYVPDALSTPIAYITSADLKCPFGGDRARANDFPNNIWQRFSYENIRELETAQVSYPVLTAKYGPAADAYEKIGGWRILSIGPNMAWNPMIQYDPTNGTVSDGNIMRTQMFPEGGAFY